MDEGPSMVWANSLTPKGTQTIQLASIFGRCSLVPKITTSCMALITTLVLPIKDIFTNDIFLPLIKLAHYCLGSNSLFDVNDVLQYSPSSKKVHRVEKDEYFQFLYIKYLLNLSSHTLFKYSLVVFPVSFQAITPIL
jgi:hypothetical protein